ncbi:TIGR01841 family phasin [Paraburkholderia phymatum]|uniref:TIGR01841 family phasin n=1 Tax=Paraburkholderia phymatum TaxID=148447 RepID=A0ACC6UAH0_9BURK
MATERLIAIPDTGFKATAERAASARREDADAVVNVCVGTAERLFELNRKAIQTSIEEQRAVSLKAAEEVSPLGAWRLHASYVLAGTAKVVAYWRHASEIILDGYADAVSEAENRLNRGFLTITGALDDVTAGVGSSMLTGDPALATASMKETAAMTEREAEGKPSAGLKQD